MWSAWAGWLTLFIAAVGSVFAIRSWQVSRRALRLSASTAGTSDLVFKADEFFLEQPALRPYFYDSWSVPPGLFESAPRADPPAGSSAESGLLRNRLLAATEYYLDILECLWDNVTDLPADDRDSYREWIHDMFENGPVLGAFLDKFPKWYPTLSELLTNDVCTQKEEHLYTARKKIAAISPASAEPEAGLCRRFAARMTDVLDDGEIGRVLSIPDGRLAEAFQVLDTA
jgi:hypothetical protein